MAFTLRLPKPLQDRAAAYAAESGISLHALVTIALREYISSRTTPPPQPMTHPHSKPRKSPGKPGGGEVLKASRKPLKPVSLRVVS